MCIKYFYLKKASLQKYLYFYCYNIYFYYVILYADEDYTKAIEQYTEAIKLNPFLAAYFGNRSFAYIRTECFGYALSDASKALSLDKNYLKVG